jgi:hypothetical protein
MLKMKSIENKSQFGVGYLNVNMHLFRLASEMAKCLRSGHVNANCSKCGPLRAEICPLPRFLLLKHKSTNCSFTPVCDNIHTHTLACHKVSSGVSITVTMKSPNVALGLFLFGV